MRLYPIGRIVCSVCLFVHLSVCPILAYNSKRDSNIDANVLVGRINQCANFQLKDSVKIV